MRTGFLACFRYLLLGEIFLRTGLVLHILRPCLDLGSLLGNFETFFLLRLFYLFVRLFHFRLSVIRVSLLIIGFRFRSRFIFRIRCWIWLWRSTFGLAVRIWGFLQTSIRISRTPFFGTLYKTEVLFNKFLDRVNRQKLSILLQLCRVLAQSAGKSEVATRLSTTSTPSSASSAAQI